MYKYFYSKKGLTLTELLVCVVILSILSGVAIPFVDKKQKRQKVNECENNCKMIETVIKEAMMGMMDNGKKQEYYVGKTCYDENSSDYMVTYSSWKYLDILAISQYEKGYYSGDYFKANKPYKKMSLIACEFETFKTSKGLNDSNKQNKYKGYLFTNGNAATNPDCQRLGYVHILNSQGSDTGIWQNLKFNNKKISEYAKTIYGSKVRDVGSVFTFLICNNKDRCLTLGLIRGLHRSASSDEKIQEMSYNEACKYGFFLKKASLTDVPISDYFPNGEIPVCPFDKEKNPYYCVFMDGTVMCMCGKCLAEKAKYNDIISAHYVHS